MVNTSFKFRLISYIGQCACYTKKNTDTLKVGSKNTGLEVNADKTKYMVMS